jgi:clan AA aspartic protease
MTIGHVQGNKPFVSVTFLLPNQPAFSLECVVDTGFAGYLTLPEQAVEVLKLPFLQTIPSRLADGSRVMLDSYLTTIRWAGQQRPVEVVATGLQPLIGRALLQGFLVSIDFRDGGDITLETSS